MAGETPGAHNANRRRKLNWNDDKSTNKIYASGDISALGDQTVADSTMKPGQTPVANPTPTLRADDKSADKYYANGGSSRVRGPQVAAGQKKLGPPPALGVAAPKPRSAPYNPNATLVVRSKYEVNGVMAELVNRLNGGATGQVVYVPAGENQLLKRARAALEMLVTREVITEEQYHDVRLSYEPKAGEQAAIAEKLGVPQAATTVKTEDNEAATVDPLDFLNGEAGEDEKVDVEATAPPTEVDTTGDVASSPAPGLSPSDDDEADNDFLSPEAPVTTAAVETMDGVGDVPAGPIGETGHHGDPGEPGEPAPAEENLPRRRGKRSGRGAD